MCCEGVDGNGGGCDGRRGQSGEVELEREVEEGELLLAGDVDCCVSCDAADALVLLLAAPRKNFTPGMENPGTATMFADSVYIFKGA